MDLILVFSNKPAGLNCKIESEILPGLGKFFPMGITQDMINKGVGYFIPPEPEFTSRIAQGIMHNIDRSVENVQKVYDYWAAKKAAVVKGDEASERSFGIVEAYQLQAATDLLDQLKPPKPKEKKVEVK